MGLIIYDRRRREAYTEDTGFEPTVPSIEDHTNPAWLVSDIYKGEIAVNGADDKVYTRTQNGILLFQTVNLSNGSSIGPTAYIRHAPYTGSTSTTYQHNSLINVALARIEFYFNSVRVPLVGYDSKVVSNDLGAGSITFNFQIRNNSSIKIEIY